MKNKKKTTNKAEELINMLTNLSDDGELSMYLAEDEAFRTSLSELKYILNYKMMNLPHKQFY